MQNHSHIIEQVVRRNKQGKQSGIFAVCTANEMVIRAALRHSKAHGYPLIVEATSNQCNQFGGYTGMRPSDYMEMINRLALEERYDTNMLVAGGDHLGPNPFRGKPVEEAMSNAEEMVRQYVCSGFDKIHIDTSMHLGGDDTSQPLNISVSAERAARLAKTAEESFADYKIMNPDAKRPVLVIGSEVPSPGGTISENESMRPTDAEEFKRQLKEFKRVFSEYSLNFEQVVAFVAQPGVEFGDNHVDIYDRERARDLINALSEEKSIAMEGHSTDYQPSSALRQLVHDGVAILKVGPALTFALREALLLLELAARELDVQRTPFRHTLECEMLKDPRYWKDYYTGSESTKAFKRIFSYSDRCRYYLPNDAVQSAINELTETVRYIPPAVMSMYFPRQYTQFMDGKIGCDGLSVVMGRIWDELDRYAAACFPELYTHA